MTCIIGIDPGKSGGIAAVWSTGQTWAKKIPETERDRWDMLATLKGAEFAFIERVASSPQMGVKSSFTFGMGYGSLRAFLVALGVPFEDVLPRKWQKAMGCLTGGDKNVSKRKAQELYPSLKITHATADALLIATYGLWTWKERMEGAA